MSLFVFHFSSLQGLQTQLHGSPTPRPVCRTQGGSAPSVQVCKPKGAVLQTPSAQVCRPARLGLQSTPEVCSHTMPHQTNLLFFIAGSAVWRLGSTALLCPTKYSQSTETQSTVKHSNLFKL